MIAHVSPASQTITSIAQKVIRASRTPLNAKEQSLIQLHLAKRTTLVNSVTTVSASSEKIGESLEVSANKDIKTSP